MEVKVYIIYKKSKYKKLKGVFKLIYKLIYKNINDTFIAFSSCKVIADCFIDTYNNNDLYVKTVSMTTVEYAEFCVKNQSNMICWL